MLEIEWSNMLKKVNKKKYLFTHILMKNKFHTLQSL